MARSEQVRESYALAMPLGVKGTLAILILLCVLQQGETACTASKRYLLQCTFALWTGGVMIPHTCGYHVLHA